MTSVENKFGNFASRYSKYEWKSSKDLEQNKKLEMFKRHGLFLKKTGQPLPLFRLFSVFSSKHQYNFYNKYMWKNVQPVYGAGMDMDFVN